MPSHANTAVLRNAKRTFKVRIAIGLRFISRRRFSLFFTCILIGFQPNAVHQRGHFIALPLLPAATFNLAGQGNWAKAHANQTTNRQLNRFKHTTNLTISPF
jgi:hypothetical protein